jgi:hypothetical protein
VPHVGKWKHGGNEFIEYRVERLDTEPSLSPQHIRLYAEEALKEVIRETDELLAAMSWYEWFGLCVSLTALHEYLIHRRIKTIVERLRNTTQRKPYVFVISCV